MNMMKTSHILASLLAFVFFGDAAYAGSSPVVTQASGPCNSQLLQFVDSPASVQYDKLGQYRVPLTTGGILSVGNCQHLYFEIGSGTGYSVYMGKISGATLSEVALTGNTRNSIQSLALRGPEITVWLTGTPNTNETVQMWFYLTN